MTLAVSGLARTPEPPYFAVVFTSLRGPQDPDGYGQTAQAMEALAERQPGFLGMESARGADGVGITVSYWDSLDAIRSWKRDGDHAAAQVAGRARWYRAYRVRICRVERAYGWSEAPPSSEGDVNAAARSGDP